MLDRDSDVILYSFMTQSICHRQFYGQTPVGLLMPSIAPLACFPVVVVFYSSCSTYWNWQHVSEHLMQHSLYAWKYWQTGQIWQKQILYQKLHWYDMTTIKDTYQNPPNTQICQWDLLPGSSNIEPTILSYNIDQARQMFEGKVQSPITSLAIGTASNQVPAISRAQPTKCGSAAFFLHCLTFPN